MGDATCEAAGRGDESRYNGPMPNEECLAPSPASRRSEPSGRCHSYHPVTGDMICTETPGAVEIRDVVGCRISSFEPLANPVRR